MKLLDIVVEGIMTRVEVLTSQLDSGLISPLQFFDEFGDLQKTIVEITARLLTEDFPSDREQREDERKVFAKLESYVSSRYESMKNRKSTYPSAA